MSISLLSEIESAARLLGIAPTTLCQRAVRNTSLPKRLADGGSVTLVTAERIRTWIKSETRNGARYAKRVAS